MGLIFIVLDHRAADKGSDFHLLHKALLQVKSI